MAITLEICVDDAAGLAAAVEGGADRIELCSALELGGLTPSPALLSRAVATGVPVHAMVRPRGGSFVHEPDEIALMADEIERVLAMGATGVVVGALRPDNRLDADALARFRETAGTALLVLHRAIDLTPDPIEAVDEASRLGFDKILSSGGSPTAMEGIPFLARMVEAANGRISIMAGSGVTPENVTELIRQTGVREVHGSASEAGPAPDARSVAMGFATGPRRMTSAATIRLLRAATREIV